MDKFKKFGLTPVAGEKVCAPLVAECFVNSECRVADTSLVDDYRLFPLESVRAWTDPS
ncbi:flavin reductase [Streptomyces olivaceoviridis]|uniref:flavin reductase n=1 Tax=Streptomyces olivaceoviridis TaxID=1921 RepID=UPI0036C3CF99